MVSPLSRGFLTYVLELDQGSDYVLGVAKVLFYCWIHESQELMLQWFYLMIFKYKGVFKCLDFVARFNNSVPVALMSRRL